MQPEWTACLLFLLGNAFWDIRTRCIHLGYTMLFAGGGILFAFLTPRKGSEILLSLLPGILLFIASSISRGSIGGGDGIALTVLGLYLDLMEVLLAACFGFLAAALTGMMLLLLKKKGEALPFLPFLLFGGIASFFLS